MAAKTPPLFYDARSGGYWFEIAKNVYLNLGKDDAKLHMLKRGVGRTEDSDGIKEFEHCFLTAQLERAVDYAGPLAGHRCGMFTTGSGVKALVSQPFRWHDAKPGEMPKLDKFLAELLGTQTEHFLYWLKFARASLKEGDFRPGQFLVLSGPSSCGKSFLQHLVTEFLGGRSACPWRYIMGETAFNADLAQSEHLMIEDKHGSFDIRARRKFGTLIKEFTVNRDLSVHAKGRQAITLPTYKRLTMSLNDEHENLLVLPPMDASIVDKVSLFKCGRAEMSEDRAQNWRDFVAEIPALAAFVDALRVPKVWKCPRYGVRAWHHPELLEFLNDVAPETRLLGIIDEVIELKDGVPWKGTADALERELRHSKLGFAAEKLLTYSSACGALMGRLQTKLPERIKQTRSQGRNLWTIKGAS